MCNHTDISIYGPITVSHLHFPISLKEMIGENKTRQFHIFVLFFQLQNISPRWFISVKPLAMCISTLCLCLKEAALAFLWLAWFWQLCCCPMMPGCGSLEGAHSHHPERIHPTQSAPSWLTFQSALLAVELPTAGADQKQWFTSPLKTFSQ